MNNYTSYNNNNDKFVPQREKYLEIDDDIVHFKKVFKQVHVSDYIVYFTEISTKKINLQVDNSSIIYKVQSYTMSFNNHKKNTTTIFRLENWTHLIF